MRARTIAALVLVSFAAVCLAAENQTDLTPDETRLKNAMLHYTEQLIRDTLIDLNTRIHAPEKSQLRKKVVALRKQPYQIPELRADALEKGQIGCFAVRFRIFQVLDKENVLVQTRDDSRQIIWLSGVDTSGLVDDRVVNPGFVYEVAGTRQYDATVGTNTVSEIIPFSIQFKSTADEKRLLEKFKKADAEAKKTKRLEK